MTATEGIDLLRLSVMGTDAEWYAATRHCGGCGMHDCHNGPCIDDKWWGECRSCPDREPS